MLSTIRALALVLFATAAMAAETFDLQPYREANSRFLELLAASEGGVAKDLRTPEFARLVALMSDEKRFLRSKKFTQADMQEVMDLCDMATLQPFHIRCMGLGMPLLEHFIRALPPDQMTPVRRDGLTKMRNGYEQLLTGMLLNIGDTRFAFSYRGAVAEAVAEASPALASVLSLSQRARLLAVVQKSEATMPREFKTSRERIQLALQNPKCSGLCAF